MSNEEIATHQMDKSGNTRNQTKSMTGNGFQEVPKSLLSEKIISVEKESQEDPGKSYVAKTNLTLEEGFP